MRTSRGFSPTPTLVLFRFLKTLSSWIIMVAQELISAKNDGETKKPHQSWCRGFSLLELLIVIGIVAVLGTVGSGYYRGFVKSVELQSVSKTLAEDMKQVRSKSMIGEDGVKWGAHVVNTSGGSQYYILFSTPTNYADAGKVAISTTTLSTGLTFSDPIAGANKDIIFTKISGTTTAATVVVVSEGKYATTTVTSIGSIY